MGFIGDIERRVIPNWRDFKRTAQLKELSDPINSKLESSDDFQYIYEYITRWEENQTIGYAADLLNAAFLINFNDNLSIQKAALKVIENDKIVSPELIILSKHFLKGNVEIITGNSFLEYSSFSQFKLFFDSEQYFKKINYYKSKTKREPRNPISWVELSRLYAIIGENEKATKNMLVACSLSPNNRYVIRSASRLFIHNLDYDRAGHILRKSNKLTSDPWQLSADISLSLIRKRFPKNSKVAHEMVNSRKFSPSQITELASSLATEELYKSNIKSSKKLFQLSLVEPNDNTLAQAEWAISKNLGISIESANSNISNPFEAKAIENFGLSNWSAALDNSLNWLIDVPYSKRPFILASYLAIILEQKYELAESICLIGLKISPTSPELINNYAFLLIMQEKPDAALLEIKKLDNLSSEMILPPSKVSLQATKGLAYFRKGQIELGRQGYDKALNIAYEMNNLYLYNMALINLLREEILINSERVPIILDSVNRHLKNEMNSDVKFLAKKIMDLIKS